MNQVTKPEIDLTLLMEKIRNGGSHNETARATN
jgi:hypothetical protein